MSSEDTVVQILRQLMQQNLPVDKCVKSLLVPLLQKKVSEEKAKELSVTLACTISI